MATPMIRMQTLALLLSLLALLPARSWPDEVTARSLMENPSHPLLLIDTSMGDIYVEMLPDEAPQNVARFIALAMGEVELRDANGLAARPNYFDGMRFHRVVPGFIIQAGSPAWNTYGDPGAFLPDEIDASSLGLDLAPAILPDGSFNPLLGISSRTDLEHNVLLPLYQQLRISTNEQVEAQQFAIADALRSMNLRQLYELQGYRYRENQPTRAVNRGTLVLANLGANTNGPEFFIPVADAHWLNGRHTVIGRVVDGMEAVDRINRIAIDPRAENRQSALIFSIRQL